MRLYTFLYWITTSLLCSLFLYSASMYFINTEAIKGFFKAFNYPTYIVIPLAVLKILGVIIILWRKNKWLVEWAYAGVFFNLVLATAARYYSGDGIVGYSFYGLMLIFPSYFLGKIVR